LQVDNFGHFILRRRAIRNGTNTDNGREIAHTPMQFGEQSHRGEIVGGGDEQERGGLPLFGGEANLIYQRVNLFIIGFGIVELGRDIASFGDGLGGEGFEVGALGGGERVGKIYKQHGVCYTCNCGRN